MLLSKPQIQKLVVNSKADRVLSGNLLPLNNNPSFLDLEDVHSVTVVLGDDLKTATPVAFGIFNFCNPNQVYCSIAVTASKYENNYVVVEHVKCNDTTVFGINPDQSLEQHIILKITKIYNELPNVSGLPQYFSAFAVPPAKPLLQAVVDELINITVGNENVFMARNLTVDLYDRQSGFVEHPDHLWRDYCGFVVADRYRLFNVDIASQNLIPILKKETENSEQKINIIPIAKSTIQEVFDYDQTVGIMDRENYLSSVLKMPGAFGFLAKNMENETVGYTLAVNNHIIQCYAEEAEIANKLLLKQAEEMNSSTPITFFFKADTSKIQDKILEKALEVRRVRRFHTRIVPTNVKWTKVFALGIGANLY